MSAEGDRRDEVPGVTPTTPPAISGEYFAVTRFIPSERPPALSILPATPHEHAVDLLDRIAAVLDGMEPGESAARLAERYVSLLHDVLPARLIAITLGPALRDRVGEIVSHAAVRSPSAAAGDSTASRRCVLAAAVDGIDVRAESHGALWATLSIERTSATGDPALDVAVAATIAPFVATSIRQAHLYAELTSKLLARDRLSTIGQFAAQFAHDISNPLTAIAVHTAFLARGAADAADRQRAAKASEAAPRVHDLARRLLDVAPATPESRATVRVEQLVADALAQCDHTLSAIDAAVETTFQTDLPLVIVARGELTRVLVNVITNGCHAMTQGQARLAIDVSRERDRCIVVRVSDNGHGMDAETAARVFEPFFTTKPAGIGTGLGLSIVRSIVEAHGGSIGLESETGVGTRFVIELPIAPASDE